MTHPAADGHNDDDDALGRALRAGAERQRAQPDADLWDRVEAGLPPVEARVRRLRPRAKRRLPAIAATLLLALAASLYFLSEVAAPAARVAAAGDAAPATPETLEVGPAEAPIVNAALYEGVRVPDGRGVLQACVRC